MSSFESQPLVASDAGDFEPKAACGKTDRPDADAFVPIRLGSKVEEPSEPPAPSTEEIRAQAYAEGLEAGRAELPWREVEELRGLIDSLEKAMVSTARLRREYLRDQRAAVVELALAMAERLVRRAIATDPAPLVDILGRALDTLPDEEKLRVALSSDDLASLQAGFSEEIAGFGRGGGVVLEGDSELARGDVVVQGERGSVDARVATLIERLRESLRELEGIPEAQP